MKRTISIVAILILNIFACTRSLSYMPMEGDIIFHTSRSAQSLAIQRATKSKFSHMGIITIRNGAPYVFEAVNPVQYTSLESWIARGEKKKYVVKRLKSEPTIFSQAAVQKLRALEKDFAGKAYDSTFEWSDDRIYCSELVWKLYNRALGVSVGKLQKLKEFDLRDPIVKLKLKERYGEKIPLDETVISPSSIYESELLITIAKN